MNGKVIKMLDRPTPFRSRSIFGRTILAEMLMLTALLLLAAAGSVSAGFAKRFARVNGVRLRYLIGGKGSPVALLHGYAQTSHMWLS